MKLIRLGLCLLLGAQLVACAGRSISPRISIAIDPAESNCEQLQDKLDHLLRDAEVAAFRVDARSGDNMVALALGLSAFWPALLAIRSANSESEKLAMLRGDIQAHSGVLAAKGCPAPSPEMPARRVASLPLGLGDRLVYEQRTPGTAPARLMVLQLTQRFRQYLEFKVEIDGAEQPIAFRQDLLGNPVLVPRPPLMAWQHLLSPDLVLGQDLHGELAAADEAVPRARLQGRVVSVGGKGVAGRDFDVTVIDLHGVAPLDGAGRYDLAQASTVIEGVMAIDRKSGVLLRLDLNCANPAYAAHWRLIRVDSPAQ